jgi:NADH-quinone oxidoreductase subunit F
MEPGTFKDRYLMERDPHQLIEGLLIAAYAVGAEHTYIFLRWAYRRAFRVLSRAVAEAEAAGYIGEGILGSSFSVDMHVHVSSGRYMCGEAEGLMDALEGRRAIPRPKPPRAVEVGLWGKPTVVNNVETLCCVPHIIRHGASWFSGLGLTDESGTKLYGVSGRVRRPGLWELPIGTSLGEVLHEKAGGMLDGYAFRGALPGGASSSYLVAEHFDLPLDFDSVKKVDSRFGTGSLVVLDDRVCPVGVLLSLQMFFARESCGWCTPCREGLPWIVHILRALEAGEGREADIDILEDHVRAIQVHHTFCELAPGAMLSIRGTLEYFRDDVERHIRAKTCPWS